MQFYDNWKRCENGNYEEIKVMQYKLSSYLQSCIFSFFFKWLQDFFFSKQALLKPPVEPPKQQKISIFSEYVFRIEIWYLSALEGATQPILTFTCCPEQRPFAVLIS